MTADQQRILQLRSELNHHNHAYYVLNAPEISDREFDMLLKELERLEAENPDMADPLSPTQRVGSDLSGRSSRPSISFRCFRWAIPTASPMSTTGSTACARVSVARSSRLWAR